MGQGDSYTLLGEVRVSPPYTLRYAVFYCFRFCEARRFKTPFQQTEKTMTSPSDQAETDRLLVTEGSRSSSPCWCRLKFNRRRKRYVQSVRFSREQKGVHPGIPAGYPRPHA